jgi:hypothetical protein
MATGGTQPGFHLDPGSQCRQFGHMLRHHRCAGFCMMRFFENGDSHEQVVITNVSLKCNLAGFISADLIDREKSTSPLA